jgi:cobalt-zinc-cadmium efflux system protein
MTDLSAWPTVLRDLQTLLREKHGIDHATLQPELTMAAPENFS